MQINAWHGGNRDTLEHLEEKCKLPTARIWWDHKTEKVVEDKDANLMKWNYVNKDEKFVEVNEKNQHLIVWSWIREGMCVRKILFIPVRA